MIDSIFQIIDTVTNKELRGNLTPAEKNFIATQVQEEIFRGYFEDANKDKNKNFNLRQKIEKFSVKATISHSGTQFTLPANLYLIKRNGIDYLGKVVSETKSSSTMFLSGSLSAASTTFPTYEMETDKITISPSSITTSVTCRYIKVPDAPKWTYTVVSGAELFDNTDSLYQDFQLHESEFSNIVIRMLSYAGINIKDKEVAQYAEALKQRQTIKEEQ